MKISTRRISTPAALLAALPVLSVFGQAADSHGPGPSFAGAVFVMTNNNESNRILRFGRLATGALVSLGSTPTGGRGSGGTVDPLGAQNSLLLTQDGGFLLAVNSASGTISAFQVDGANLELVDVKHTGGSAPNAIGQWGNLVYVLNVAGNSSVVGFHLEDGHLIRIPGAIGYLSTAISGGSSVSFTPDGKFLIVTERVTNKVDSFPVNADGTVGAVVSQADPKAGLFLLAMAPSGVAVSLEPGSGVVTASIVNSDGTLTAVSSTADSDGGTCWDVVTPNGKYVYAADTAGDTISGFSLSAAGMLAPINATNVAAKLTPGSKALDLAVSYDGKYLYSTNAGNGSVGIWTIKADGTLKAQTFVSLPASDASAGFNGIAAY
jgi:6-phosphogluconolactonase (cycloisomerase 2 family)